MKITDSSELQVFVNGLALKSYTVNDDGDWVFEGLASTHDVDLQDEVIYPESFLNSIEFFKSNGKIYFDHEYAKKPDEWLEKFGFTKDEILSLKTPIGKPIDASLTNEGLMIKGVLNKQHPIAQKMWVEFLDNPDESFRDQIGLSIGAKYMGSPRREYNVKKGKYVTVLPDLLLYEVSMTPVPVNPHTWTTAVKSLTGLLENDIKHHDVKPDSLEYDEESGEIVIKSVVGNEDGTTHVMENRLNKEDILKLMDKDKITTKAVEDVEKKEEVETQEDPAASAETAPPALDVTEDIVDEVVPGAEEGEPEVGGDPLAEEGGADPLAGAGADPLAGGADPLAGGDEGGFLDGLAGEPEDPLAPTEDAATELLLDKQDIMLELLAEIKDALSMEVTESQLPMDDQITDTLVAKSTEVSLSEESTQEFTTALKSVFDDFEDRIVAKVLAGLANVQVTKSIGKDEGAKEKVVRAPGVVAVNGVDPDDNVTLKSLQPDLNATGGNPELDKTVLKSFVNEYRNITGHSTSAIQKRSQVVEKATKQLNLKNFEFHYYVGLADKGNL